LIDLDLFKQINDAHGHLVGDEVLKHFVQILKGCCRLSDFLVRLGGEEFLVLSAGDIDGALVLAEKIRAAVENAPLAHADTKLCVTVSVGVAETGAEDGAGGLSALLTRADRALYRAKQSGRNRVVAQEQRQRRSA
jgi:diguanylate cyclase (GGDEF)-like protein